MSSTVTDLPLHEVVLEILYKENTEKAASMSPEDVLWRIDNPEISERQVREVLDWLVRHRRVEVYLSKYSLDRIEFLEQKEKHKEVPHTAKRKQSNAFKKSVPVKKSAPKAETFYVKPPEKEEPSKLIYSILFVLCIIAFGYVTYTYVAFASTTETAKSLIAPQKKEPVTIDAKLLYVSKDEEYTKNAKSAISNSFYRQNQTNQLVEKELDRLQNVIDSVLVIHNQELVASQEVMQAHVVNTNNLINRIIIGNILLVLFFLVLYFKK